MSNGEKNMDAKMLQTNAPVNFFMAGGHFITDNFNMKIIDTSLPNAFEDYDFVSIKPDMMSEYIESEKLPPLQDEVKGGVFASISNFFGGQKNNIEQKSP